ncbi:nitroreductase family protein [Labrys wisconsinensis]|uniref:Nitroreductase n=1 Tax=Labrys wisconsinensis TaxID=425677 RepID=A0ABU0J5I4_9HYPH|nr:nitroreductase family protein [Labrys wisconsinensis]MDQ0469520.1 nitroreductase [Labrys wisconsinensis]
MTDTPSPTLPAPADAARRQPLPGSIAGGLRQAAGMVWLELRLIANHVYDYARFRGASFIHAERGREHRRAHIHILAHMIEYGLALPDPRLGFGRDRRELLLGRLSDYLDRYGLDEVAAFGLKALDGYCAANRGADLAGLDAALDALDARHGFRRHAGRGGTEEVTADAIRRVTAIDFAAFMQARHSVRHYAPQPVSAVEIEQAVAIAQQTPSSCNRQTCRVHAFTEPDKRARVLALQSGNRGFGHEIGAVMVVTADMAHLNTVGERNQAFVDGGMFAMTLALGFHGQGMGAVMLNWSVTAGRDRALRRLAGLADSELVITLIGAGHLPERFRVPVSQRKSLAEILRIDPALAG